MDNEVESFQGIVTTYLPFLSCGNRTRSYHLTLASVAPLTKWL